MDFSCKWLDAISSRVRIQLRNYAYGNKASFLEVWLNPVAQSKFLHTLSAGYVVGSLFVLGISSYYILKGRIDIGFAKRSFSIASVFGIITTDFVLIMGD